MNHLRRILLTMLVALPWFGALADTPPARPVPRLLTGDLPPFGIESGKPGRGFLVELTENLSERLGTPRRVEFMPWARAVMLPTQEDDIAIFPLTRTPEREPKYRWLTKLTDQHFIFLTRRDGRYGQADIATLRGTRIGVLRGSPHVALLMREGVARENLVEEVAPRDLFRQLDLGAIDAIFGSDVIYGYEMTQQEGGARAYRLSKPLASGEVWLGGSLNLTPTDADAWQRARAAAEKDGTVAKLRRKYGLSEK